MTASTIAVIAMLKMAWVWLPITAMLLLLSEIEKVASRKVSHHHK